MRIFVMLLLLLTNCALEHRYHECTMDSDCPRRTNGAPQFCTSDALCVPDTPLERLCTVTLPETPEADSIHIGALLDLVEGDEAAQVRRRVLEVAVEELNEQCCSKIMRPIAVHLCDVSRSSGDVANAVDLLVRDHSIVGVIGLDNPSALQQALAPAKAARIPLLPIKPTTIGTDSDSGGVIFPLSPTPAQEAEALATRVENGVRVALAYSSDSFGSNAYPRFQSSWERKDPQRNVLLTPLYSLDESRDDQLSSVAGGLQNRQPNYAVLLLANTNPEMVELLRGLMISANSTELKNSAKTTQILLTSKGRTQQLFHFYTEAATAGEKDLIGRHLQRVLGVSPLALDTTTERAQLEGSYEEGQGMASTAEGASWPNLDRDAFAGYLYDAFYLLSVAALSTGDTTTGEQVLAVLQRCRSQNNLLEIHRATLPASLKRIQMGEDFALEGATGQIRFGTDAQRASPVFERWAVDFPPGEAPRFVRTP